MSYVMHTVIYLLSPLVVYRNEDGEDMMEVLKEKYVEFSECMRVIHLSLEAMGRKVIVPTELDKLQQQNVDTIRKMREMQGFLVVLDKNFRERLRNIDSDRLVKRRHELKHEVSAGVVVS
jgi:hypothetical protein